MILLYGGITITEVNYIRERFDTVVADAAWRVGFPSFWVINGDRPRPGDQSFRFEAGWIQEDNCCTIMQNAWNLTVEARAGSAGDAVPEAGVELWDWSRNVLGDLEKRIKRAKMDQEACRRRGIDAYDVVREEILKYKPEKMKN